MTEIIPAILTDSEDELVRLVHILERAGVKRAHLDICDGTFVPTHTVEGYTQLTRLAASLEWDVHLMVKEPEQYVDHWWRCGCARRFIVHVEATDMMPALIEHAHGHSQELWAAINPDTPLEKLDGAGAVDGVTFMTVVPGKQGNPFRHDVVERMSAYHAQHPETALMVDGGITPETASPCALAGAGILVSGSYIVKSPDPAKALADLRSSLQ